MAQSVLLQLPEGWRGVALDQKGQESAFPPFPITPFLHVAIAIDGSYKIGTCEHCVLQEQGRPERAWDAEGDTELDFQRDLYFSLLAHFGIVMTERQAYVCP